MKRQFRKIVSICIVLSFFAGCATRPDKISATYVSPLQYQGYSCNQIGQELMRVNRKIMEITRQQDKEADKDAVALGVGMILFWPALFFMIGDDKKDELASLKGEYEALQGMAIQKECNVTAELQEAKKQHEEYKEKRQQRQQMNNDEEDGISDI